MLNRVPHRDDIDLVAKIKTKVVPLRRVDAALLNGKADGVAGDVDAACRSHPSAHLVEKEAVGAANLEQVALRKVGRHALQRREPIAEVEAQARLFGHIVEIFAALEVVLAVERPQLVIGYAQIRR